MARVSPESTFSAWQLAPAAFWSFSRSAMVRGEARTVAEHPGAGGARGIALVNRAMS